MSVTCTDVINGAKALEKSSVKEIEIRNAISRTYYGYFHSASEYMNCTREIPVSDLSGSTHQKLSNLFKNDAAKPTEKKRCQIRIGLYLEKCCKRRCEADYDLERTVESELLELQALECEKGIELLAELSKF